VTRDNEARYAVYFVPAPDSDLYGFGSAMLGYDAYSGDDLPRPADLDIDDPDWRALTEEPRRYGFHATLKAPFRLAPSRREEELIAAVRAFACRPREIAQIAPQVRLLGAFTAIVPRAPAAALAALAAACTTEFDQFRAPLSEQERARRNPSRLSERQVSQLDRWGYPYVFDDFRFHMTLTGPLPVERRDDVPARLRESFARAWGDRPIAVDRIGLFKQAHAGARFRVLYHAPLAPLHQGVRDAIDPSPPATNYCEERRTAQPAANETEIRRD
jgi:putative phosphonate metabolism protein